MHLTVLGAGYVGLLTAACLAELGNRVSCLDIDADRVTRLLRGELPHREPGLDELVTRHRDAGRLTFHTDPSASHGTDLAFVVVGTLDDAGEWTSAHVRSAVEALARDPAAPRGLVIRSTLLPGTAVELERAATAIDPRIQLCFNPDFTREASAIADFMRPDRVVVGVDGADPEAPLVDALRKLYGAFDVPVVVTDLTTAEMIKMASNVFLAAKVGLANELARLSGAVAADIDVVVDGMGLDRRIGRGFLSPGPGFGGSCLPSQARALPALAARLGVETPLLGAIDRSNGQQAEWLVDRLAGALGGSLAGCRVAVLGLAFKAGIDDLRESPALRLVEGIHRRGAHVVIFDPLATQAAAASLAAAGIGVEASTSAEQACAGTDAVVVATEWPEFGTLDWKAIGPTMRGLLVLDTRNVVDRPAARAAGREVLVHGVVA